MITYTVHIVKNYIMIFHEHIINGVTYNLSNS